MCLKKVPTFKLHVSCQILTDFESVCIAGKRMKFAIKPVQHYPSHLTHVATLPWKSKNFIFWRYLTDMEEYANKLHFKCTDFNSSIRV